MSRYGRTQFGAWTVVFLTGPGESTSGQIGPIRSNSLAPLRPPLLMASIVPSIEKLTTHNARSNCRTIVVPQRLHTKLHLQRKRLSLLDRGNLERAGEEAGSLKGGGRGFDSNARPTVFFVQSRAY